MKTRISGSICNPKRLGRIVFILCLSFSPALVLADDLHIGGTLPVGLDIPHIWALFRQTPGGPPLQNPEYGFAPVDAYFDTGASGIVLSLETAEILGIPFDLNSSFVDVGVGGEQYFGVSKPLYLALADYGAADPLNPSTYQSDLGAWSFQLTLEEADPLVGALDILGIPAMAGKTIVLDPTPLDTLTDYFYASVKESNDPSIPPVDFEVVIHFTNFLNRTHPENTGTLPVLAYNPVITNISILKNALTSSGDWLFDTGASVSMISIAQAHQLGLTDANGTPVIPPDFTLPIGGIGGAIEAPGYILDEIRIPTRQAFALVYDNPSVIVANIGTIDEHTGEPIILDGVFGTNLIAASATMSFDIVEGPFNRIVVDTQRAILGFDLKDQYALPPTCGSNPADHPAGDIVWDCGVNLLDFEAMAGYWGIGNYYPSDALCLRSDIDQNGLVNLLDFARLAKNWQFYAFAPVCGDAGHPWLSGDYNRDCRTDSGDLEILSRHWTDTDCSWLNWYCVGSDMNRDGTVNFQDTSLLAQSWLLSTEP